MADTTSSRYAVSVGEERLRRLGKRVDELVVLSVSGNVDMLSAPWLTEAIDAALAKRPAGLVVDLSRVDFLGSAGISVLMTTHGNMGDSGRFAVVADG
ncbi:STAS domain-containing protein, partial [Mycolicibacterium vaccae]|nr:STAS domain-containing protein [Mycolicibacterium vaccae]